MTSPKIDVLVASTQFDSPSLIEAERFIAAVSRDRFDYTEWRSQGLPRMDMDELAQSANLVSRQLDKES